MNATIILTCILFLLPMYAMLYRQQPYYAKQLILSYIPKVYCFVTGAAISCCAILIFIASAIERVPFKANALALVLLIAGFSLAKSSFKK